MSSGKRNPREHVERILWAHIRDKRVAHTYLFSGSNEEAKRDLVMEFACALNEEDKRVFGDLASTSSRKILKGIHPDVRWLGHDPKARSIKIEEIREMIMWATLKPYEGHWKVFVIAGAERMTVEAQNAILKTLEEPPEQTVICLLVETKEGLLDTIRSRSFEIRVWPAPVSEHPFASDTNLLAMREKEWEDFFEGFQSVPRLELQETLSDIMGYFRHWSEKAARCELEKGHAFLGTWLEVMDALYEGKNALDANVNQKLVLTRLAIQMKRILPKREMLKVGL